MNKILSIFLLFAFACVREGIVITKTKLPLSRKTYADLSEKQYDSVKVLDPEMEDVGLKKAGLVKHGRLLVEKFNHNGGDFELQNNDETISAKCGSRNEAFRIILTQGDISKDIITNSPNTQFCIADVIPGGYPEIVTLDINYIVNGDNYEVTVYEIEENP
ncbi:hypothetical protein [Flavobacterium sp.]|uniref:hypothetical protein n=1 Tax=Flavobacterium sp. TaxID=239 RepID=UPI0040334185